MATLNVDPIRPQLSTDWTEILDGLSRNGFWDKVTIELARPALGHKLTKVYEEAVKICREHRNGELSQFYRAQRDPLEREMEINNTDYRHLFDPAEITILWQRIKMVEYTNHANQLVRYPKKGAFLCRLRNVKFPNDVPGHRFVNPYGFFDARRGSCGFNNCSSQPGYGTFYVGEWEEIWQFALTDKQRKLVEENGYKDKLE